MVYRNFILSEICKPCLSFSICATYLTLSLRDNGIATPQDMAAFQNRTEETLASLTKQRTILNVRKKKREPLYASLSIYAGITKPGAAEDFPQPRAFSLF